MFNSKLFCIAFFFLLGCSLLASAQKKPIHEVQVIKFDNYGPVAGEQTIFDQRYLQDTTGLDVAPVFDVSYSIAHFSFPPTNDTLMKCLKSSPSTRFKPAVFDSSHRLVEYFRGPVEHYTFEYNAIGNLLYIKRWGAKHVTAQLTFIYY